MNHSHTWEMVETGYERSWSVEIDEESKTIIAYSGGSEDFSDGGIGDEHLRCSICLETKPIPGTWEVDYQ